MGAMLLPKSFCVGQNGDIPMVHWACDILLRKQQSLQCVLVGNFELLHCNASAQAYFLQSPPDRSSTDVEYEYNESSTDISHSCNLKKVQYLIASPGSLAKREDTISTS